MEYVYAALFLHQLGQEVNEANIIKLAKAVGKEPDEIKIKALISALKQVNIDEVLKHATAVPSVVAAAPSPVVAPAAETKKEEKKEEKREEALEGLAALFG